MPLQGSRLLIDRYCLDQRLGASGARQTWLAKGPEGQAVTVKALYFGQGMEWQDLKLFEREVATLRHLDHPQIPHYLDSFGLEEPEGNYFCLVQAYIPGRSLAELIQAGRRFSAPELEALAVSLLAVLIYLHGQSPPVIHRDIKPSNLIQGADGLIYLIDFGSVQAQSGSGRTVTVVGTYGYMSPEQFGGRAIPASDLYSLGMTLINLMTGQNPADLPQKNLRALFQINGSTHLHQWLARLIEPDLERRFSSAPLALKFLQQPELSNTLTPPLAPSQRIQFKTSAQGLDIQIPQQGQRFWDVVSMGAGGLIMIPSAIGALVTPFLLLGGVWLWPFSIISSAWNLGQAMAGWWLVRRGYVRMWGQSSFVMSGDSFEVQWNHQTYRGRIRDIVGVELDRFSIKNGQAWDLCIFVRMKNGNTKKFPFGTALNDQERVWLLKTIRTWLTDYANS